MLFTSKVLRPLVLGISVSFAAPVFADSHDGAEEARLKLPKFSIVDETPDVIRKTATSKRAHSSSKDETHVVVSREDVLTELGMRLEIPVVKQDS